MTIIKHTTHFHAYHGYEVRKTFLSHNGKYYMVSESDKETLIFPAQSDGTHTWLDIDSALHTSDAIRKIQNGQIMS